MKVVYTNFKVSQGLKRIFTTPVIFRNGLFGLLDLISFSAKLLINRIPFIPLFIPFVLEVFKNILQRDQRFFTVCDQSLQIIVLSFDLFKTFFHFLNGSRGIFIPETNIILFFFSRDQGYPHILQFGIQGIALGFYAGIFRSEPFKIGACFAFI